MPANHDPTLSILLCCLPFLLLLLLAPHLRLGPFRLNGILYHFHLPFHPQHPKPARQIIHETEWMMAAGDEIWASCDRTTSGLIVQTSKTPLIRQPEREARTKMVQFHEGSSLPQRTVEGLRKIVRKCRRNNGEERFWSEEEDMPIIKVLHD